MIVCRLPSSTFFTALMTCDCYEIEGIFARTRMPLRDFSFLLETIGGWRKIFLSLAFC